MKWQVFLRKTQCSIPSTDKSFPHQSKFAQSITDLFANSEHATNVNLNYSAIKVWSRIYNLISCLTLSFASSHSSPSAILSAKFKISSRKQICALAKMQATEECELRSESRDALHRSVLLNQRVKVVKYATQQLSE